MCWLKPFFAKSYGTGSSSDRELPLQQMGMRKQAAPDLHILVTWSAKSMEKKIMVANKVF